MMIIFYITLIIFVIKAVKMLFNKTVYQRAGVLPFINVQTEEGNIKAVVHFNEQDLRFVYAALSICRYLGNFEGVDKEKTLKFIT